ncbi:hypothetical protein GcM1_250273 [Golovinomyces cichoracearum]|uniref:Integral membrane protein n=1 Tax=Golovinomyces cichoracearum TaxID=62708 RepID=A0A420IBE5_9PEZI|nr:hypothetical protein GcM1_250273 [Golovinomyces cichoracearum]
MFRGGGMVHLNCTNAPAAVSSDSSIAGIGVLLSFILTAGVSVFMSGIIILKENRKKRVKVIRKMLLSFSDQQIITGIGLQGLGLTEMKRLVPYHFFILWMLSLLSTVTHINTLLALVNDFKRDWILRWLRQFFMFVNLLLSVTCGIFLLMVVIKDLEPTLPIACVWEVPSTSTPPNVWISIAATIAVITGQAIFFVVSVWYLHVKERRWISIIQLTGLFFFTAIGIGAVARVVLVSQAFGSPSVPLSDNQEKVWDFGQILSMLLLILPLISAVEILRGELKVPCQEDDFKKNPGKPTRSQTVISFEPNPFWGHRDNTNPEP